MRSPTTALALFALGASSAWAQTGPAPAYVADLEPFTVRALDGDYAPTDDNVTMAHVTPAEWLTGDPGTIGLRGTLAAWSGGFKATAGTKLWVHGGGHNDSANNGLYEYDFAGDERPAGFSLRSISALAAVRRADSDADGTVDHSDYTDGMPNAIHSYDGLVFAEHDQQLYRFGGAHYNAAGGFSRFAWRFDLADGTWEPLDPLPNRSASAVSTLYDPQTGKVLARTSSSSAAFFRTDSLSWSSATSGGAGVSVPFDVNGAWDPTRERGLLIGVSQNRLWEVDFARERHAISVLELTGDTEVTERRAPSVIYDQARDVYWAFGGQTNGNDGVWQALYEIDAQSFVVTRYPLQGDVIAAQSQQGSYGRYVFMSRWRAIGFVASVEAPAYVIKLPDVRTPRAPDLSLE